jgi:hypothetical protein
MSPFLPTVWIAGWMYAWLSTLPAQFMADNMFTILMWLGVLFTHSAVCAHP